MSNPYRDKLLSIGIAPSATPTREPVKKSEIMWQQHNERDVPAYRRLRADGVQPQSVHGAAWLEKHADTVEQVEGSVPELPDGYEWTGKPPA